MANNGEGFDENIDDTFYHFMSEHLIYDDAEIVKHPSIPVFSFLKSKTGLQSVHYIFLCSLI